jgi:type VI secretion system VasD/TssJ family lipoprotein
MKKYFLVIFLFCLIAMVSIYSCRKPPAAPPTGTPSATASPPPQPAYTPPPPTEWRYEKDGIRLHLKGDPQLNLFQGEPHTLLVCLYNLSDPNAFNQLVGEREGLTKLLEGGRFDSSALSSKRMVIQPGQEVNEAVDRAEGAKYVALVAGYYSLQKEKMVRLFPIPILEESKGLIFRTKTSIPAILNLTLYLGPQEIQEPRGK